jgi:VanZ family protein
MTFSAAASVISGFARTTRAAAAIYPVARAYATLFFGIAIAVFTRQPRRDAYDMLWVVVFAFATLNILGLAARRMEPGRRGLSFGELMAVGVVVLSVILLAVEMLGSLHIFPIKLHH